MTETNGARRWVRNLQPVAIYWTGPFMSFLLMVRLLSPPAVFSHNPSWEKFDAVAPEWAWAILLAVVLIARAVLSQGSHHRRIFGYLLGACVWSVFTLLFFLSNTPGAIWLFALAVVFTNVAAVLDPRSWE